MPTWSAIASPRHRCRSASPSGTSHANLGVVGEASSFPARREERAMRAYCKRRTTPRGAVRTSDNPQISRLTGHYCPVRYIRGPSPLARRPAGQARRGSTHAVFDRGTHTTSVVHSTSSQLPAWMPRPGEVLRNPGTPNTGTPVMSGPVQRYGQPLGVAVPSAPQHRLPIRAS